MVWHSSQQPSVILTVPFKVASNQWWKTKPVVFWSDTTVVISTHDLSGPNQAALVPDPNQTLVLTFWILHLFAFLQSLDYWRLMLRSRLWMCKMLSFSQKLNQPAPQTLTNPHIKPCLVIFLHEEQSVETIICLSMSFYMSICFPADFVVTGDRSQVHQNMIFSSAVT